METRTESWGGFCKKTDKTTISYRIDETSSAVVSKESNSRHSQCHTTTFGRRIDENKIELANESKKETGVTHERQGKDSPLVKKKQAYRSTAPPATSHKTTRPAVKLGTAKARAVWTNVKFR